MKASTFLFVFSLFFSLFLGLMNSPAFAGNGASCLRSGMCLQINADQEILEEFSEYFENKTGKACCMHRDGRHCPCDFKQIDEESVEDSASMCCEINGKRHCGRICM